MANERDDPLTLSAGGIPITGRLITDLDTGIGKFYTLPYTGSAANRPYLTSIKKPDGTWDGWRPNGNFFEELRDKNSNIESAYTGNDAIDKLSTAFYTSNSSNTLNKGRINQFKTYGAPETAKTLGLIPQQQQQTTPQDDLKLTFDEVEVDDILGTNIGSPTFEGNKFPPSVANNILRYPSTIIDDSTDYLQISIQNYSRPGTGNFTESLIRKPKDKTFKSKDPRLAISNIGYIILPIPSTIQDGNSVSYADGNLDSLTGAAVGGSLNVMTTSFRGKNASQISTELKTKAGDFLNRVTDAGIKDAILRSLAIQAASIIPGAGSITPDQLLSRISGSIMNPNMELLFNGVTLRSFKFSFKLTPRSEDEAKEIKKIIRTLKLNMSPVVPKNDNFLKTPNVFNLNYMKGREPHPFLHKFKTCALTDMSVNYTGEGLYATYSDASPISMIMDLTFKELEPIYDIDYEDGFADANGVGY